MQVEVGPELQAAIGMGDCQCALDVVGDRFAGSVGNVVDRQYHDVVANADTAIFPAPGMNGAVCLILRHDAYHLLVLQLWVWT